MKILTAVAASTCALLTTVASAAQGGNGSADAPSPSPPAAAAPTTSPTPVTACRGGVDPGIDDVDAATATQLVCSEIARAGAPAGARYMVSLGRLGTMIILTVTRDGEAPNTIADSREARLHGIEEVSLVAPRIADAVVHGTTLKDTESVNNLVGDETRTPATKSAKMHFALGIIGEFPPLSRSAAPVPGANLELHAEANPFEIVGNFRFAPNSGDPGHGGVQVGFFDFSIGGRFFTTDADFSPYLGGGLAWSYFQVNDANTFRASNSGLGAYVEGGVEILRTHHAHLAFGVRADLPFFSLKDDGETTNGSYVGGTYTPMVTTSSAQSLYYVPLSFELRLTF